MESRKSDSQGESQQLYPFFLLCFGLALVGTFWALQGGEQIKIELSPPQWERVPEVDIGVWEPQIWEAPLDLRWQESPERTFVVRMSQLDQFDDDGEVSLDVRMEFQWTESILDTDVDERLIHRRLMATGLDVRHGDEEVNRLLHQQVAMVLDAANYEVEIDSRGRRKEVRWLQGINPGLEPLASLMANMLEVLAPRFPAEPVLVGESWSYQMPLPDGMSHQGRPTGGTVYVNARLAQVVSQGIQDLAVIDREIFMELNTHNGVDATSVVARGGGTAYFDLHQGRLLAADLRIRRASIASDLFNPRAASTTEIEAVWLPLE